MTDWDGLIDQLNSDLRTDAIDALLLDFIDGTKFEDCVSVMCVIRHIEDRRDNYEEYGRIPDSVIRVCCRKGYMTLSSLYHPKKQIMQFFAANDFEEQLFAYLSRFCRADPEEVARAYETSEAGRFLCDNGHTSRKWRHAEQELNFFRLAQKMRNEFGTVRKNSRPKCFQSFEDIVQLERKFRDKDLLVFMVQFAALEVIDWRHTRKMYDMLPTRSQLLAFQDEFLRVDPDRLVCYRAFEFAFENKEPKPPTWPEVRKFLSTVDSIDWCHNVVDDVDNLVLSGELDEALCCVLNHFVKTWPFGAEFESSVKLLGRILEEFLVRGANLFFRDADEKLSTLGAFAWLVFSESTLEQCSRYICCPLRLEDDRVEFDHSRVAPLSCLAARTIDWPLQDLRLPQGILSFIEAHGELRSGIEGGSSFAENPESDQWFLDPYDELLSDCESEKSSRSYSAFNVQSSECSHWYRSYL